MSQRWRRTIPAIVLVILTFVVYAPAFRNGFVAWDDPETIADNPHFRPPTFEGLLHHWTTPASGLYVPVTYSIWWLLALPGGGPAPLAYHLASIAAHAACVVTVYAILRSIGAATITATLGAALFAAHPTQVETVAWASGLKDVLAGLCALLFIFLHLQADGAEDTNRQRRLRRFGAMMFLAAGVLCKPSAVVAPVIVLAIDLIVRRAPAKGVLMKLWPTVLIVGPCLVWSRAVQITWPETITPLSARPLIALDALSFYVRHVFWPAKLTILYGRTPSAVLAESDLNVEKIAVTMLAAALALWISRKRPLVLCGAATFFVSLLPVLGLTPFMFQIHSTVADHYLYLPMLGVAMCASDLAAFCRRFAGSAILLAILACAALSFRQVLVWRDSVSLFGRAVEITPKSVHANAQLGSALASAGRLADAIPRFEFVAKAVPGNRQAQRQLAQANVFAGRFEAAIAPAIRSIELAPPGDDAAWDHVLLGRAMLGAGKLDDAEREFFIAAQGHPEYAGELNAARERRAKTHD